MAKEILKNTILSDEEKQKIEEEEKLRSKIRRKEKEKKDSKSCTTGCIGIIVIIVLIVLGVILFSDDSSNTSHETPANTINNWYEGGSLHKAKISVWKASTDKNKLATCADFMATVDNSVSMNELKKRATNLKLCINETVIDMENINNQSVSEIAALCIVTIGY